MLLQVDWTSDDPDAVAISRLKKASVASGFAEEQVNAPIMLDFAFLC